MDTPSRNGLVTVDLSCSCGASLRQVDFARRTNEAAEEFRRVHVTELCGVSERPEAIRCPWPESDEQAVEWYGRGSATLDWYRAIARAREQGVGEVWVWPVKGQKP